VTVNVLSTMEFGHDWLAALAGGDERVEILEIPAERADELPDDVLREVEVMYTNLAFPTSEQAPRLRWVQLDTSGADHVRGTPVWENGAVTITSIAGVSPQPMAEYVMAMVLGFAHRLPNAARMRGRRRWPAHRERWRLYKPLPVTGSRMTIVGYGRIGRGIARSARAFDIEVVGVSRTGGRTAYGDEVGGVEVVGVGHLEEALSDADWVIVCVPGTPETMGLIGATQFAAMKDGAHLVNVSRGGVVGEQALLEALDSGRLAGAALDVFESEPLPGDSPLWEDWRIILTQHISGLACDYQERVRRLFGENLARYLAGEPLVNVIDRRLGY
jgi:phosphoglycerate dehydrogenase-like enzyme